MFSRETMRSSFVVSGLVEEITETDHTGHLAGEVHSQGGCAAGEQARNGIEFLATSA